MTVDLQLEEHAALLHVRASGKLTHADYEKFVPAVDSLIAERRRARILFEMEDFHGWTAGALWDDISFGFKHLNGIERIAIVGEKSWEHGLAMFCKPFVRARIRYFRREELDTARAWLVEDGYSFDFSAMPSDVEALMQTLNGEDGLAREKARSELVIMGGAATEHLVRAAKGGRWQLRLEATRALAAMSDPATIGVLVDQFEDTFEIGWAASEGISRLGRKGAEAALQKLEQDHDSHGVRTAVLHALRSMNDGQVRVIVADVVLALQEPIARSPERLAAMHALEQLKG